LHRRTATASGAEVEEDGVELVPQDEQWLEEEVPPHALGSEADRVVPLQGIDPSEACCAPEPRAAIAVLAGAPAADLDLRGGGVAIAAGSDQVAPRPASELQGYRAGRPVETRNDGEHIARALLAGHRESVRDHHPWQGEGFDHCGGRVHGGAGALGDDPERCVDGGLGAACTFWPVLHRQGAVHGG
jgi:hypothetical protein